MPAEYREDPRGRHEPDYPDHEAGAFLGPLPQVLERRRYRPVPVQAEDEEVEDGRGGGRVVHGEPQLADVQAEPPVACSKEQSRKQ